MSAAGHDSQESIPRRVDVPVVPISYHFEDDTLFTTIEGPTTYEDVKRYLDALTSDPRFREGMPGLIDCRRVKSLFSVADLRRTAADLRARPEIRGRAAVLASSNLVYGLLRMYEVFSDGDPVELRVFRQPDEALAWLRGGDD
jgi:hypothetical protein